MFDKKSPWNSKRYMKIQRGIIVMALKKNVILGIFFSEKKFSFIFLVYYMLPILFYISKCFKLKLFLKTGRCVYSF